MNGTIEWISKLLKQIKWFLKLLLSNSAEVSMRRFLALCSFCLIVLIAIVTLKKNFSAENASIINTAIKYLFSIVGLGIFGITASDVASNFFKRGNTDDDK